MKVIVFIFIFMAGLFANESLEKVSPQLTNDLTLTDDEKGYLKNNSITYAGDPNWLPFEAFDTNGNYAGIIAEHIEIVEKKLNKKLDKIITKNWLDTLELSKKRGVDIISGDAADVVLSQNYKAIDTYIKNPLVIVTRKEHPYVDDLNHIKDEKIAFGVGGGYSADILKKYPDIKFIACDTPQSGLLGVKTGQYDAFIGTLSMSDYTIVQMGIEDIKIAGQIGIVMNVTLFVDKNKPLLYSILNKSIKTISKAKQHEIISKWRSTKVKSVIDYTLVWQILIVSFILFLIGLFAYLRERKLNKTIQEEKNKFQNIFYKASDGISILTDGVFTEGNDAFVRLLGYKTKKQTFNLTPSQLSPEYQPDGQSSLDKSVLMMKIAKEHGANNFEWVHKRADGTEFWADIMLTDISTNYNETIIHVVWRNIQKRKELKRELIELNTSLEKKIAEEVEKNRQQQLVLIQQSRYAQMGEMISMIAHQWRQPLNNLSMIIQGASLKYQLGKFDDELMVKLSKDAQKQIMQMSQTIDDFRNLFRPNKHAKVFSVNTTILHVLALVEPILKQENIIVETHLEDAVTIKGFSNELVQVLINILNNAKDALVEKNSDKKKIITIALKQENDTVVILVKDNSGGIAEEIMDKIFDPYFSTKEGKNGTGLGLYMSKSIIEEHCQGQLSVKNGRNGAIFTIVLGGVS